MLHGNSRPQKGFTLLETVIAVAILSSALLLLSNSWGGAFMRVKKTQTSFEAAAMLERKMNDIELEWRGKTLDEIPEEKDGDFGEESKQYTWKMTSKKLEFPDLSSALTAKEGGASQMLMMVVKQLVETLSKTIKEVTVTVIYKPENAKKAIEYSVTTYFVDYDKEMNFGIGGG